MFSILAMPASRKSAPKKKTHSKCNRNHDTNNPILSRCGLSTTFWTGKESREINGENCRQEFNELDDSFW